MLPLNRFIKKWCANQSATITIVAITALVWLLVSLIDYGGAHWGNAFPRFSLLSYLWLEGDFTLIVKQPWRLVTYFFVHNSLGHLAINLLLLYYFGSITEQILGKKRLLTLYFFGGVVAGLFYPLAFCIMRLWGVRLLSLPLLGASGAIFSLMMSLATFAPRKKFAFFGQELPLALPIALLLLWGLLSASFENRGGLSAHLGGVFMGLFYAILLRYKGLRFIYKPDNKIEGEVVYISRYDRRKKNRIVPEKKGLSPQNTTAKEKEVETIMKKIQQSGYSCLTDKEKKVIFDHSTEDHDEKEL